MPDVAAPGACVADLTWDRVEARIRRGAIAVLPIGAAAKEHGWHLPMATDQIQVEWLAARLARRFDVLIWPTVTYGYYPAFVEYPGSTGIREDVFVALVRDIARAILTHAVRRLCLLNAGVSTKPGLARLEQETPGLQVINIYDGEECRAASARWLEQAGGGHADERETSIMLRLAPERVALARATCAGPAQTAPGPLRRRDASQANFSPSGVTGDPSLATPEKGQHLLDAIWRDVRTAIAAVRQGFAP